MGSFKRNWTNKAKNGWKKDSFTINIIAIILSSSKQYSKLETNIYVQKGNNWLEEVKAIQQIHETQHATFFIHEQKHSSEILAIYIFSIPIQF